MPMQTADVGMDNQTSYFDIEHGPAAPVNCRRSTGHRLKRTSFTRHRFTDANYLARDAATGQAPRIGDLG